MARSHITKI